MSTSACKAKGDTGLLADTPASSPQHSYRHIHEVADLECLFDRSLNIVALRREPSAALREEGRLAAHRVGLRELLSVAPNETASSVAERIGAYPRVAEEIALWSQVLQDLTGCDGVGVRLARVDHAMCPRFHVDRVTLRVVVTYHGLGSEFVSNESVIRSHPNGACATTEPTIAVSDAAVVQQAQTFDAVFLKGEAWPDNTGRGAVHRSPFASKELPRLVLTLDPMMSV